MTIKLIVDNKKTHIVSMANHRRRVVIRLAPGPNKITKVAWDAVKDHPSVQCRIDDGDIIIKGQVEEAIDPITYLELNAARARKEARQMEFDRGTIEAWLKMEKRASVKHELEKRLKAEGETSDGG